MSEQVRDYTAQTVLFILGQVVRALEEAVHQDRKFAADIKAGTQEGEPKDGWKTFSLDGSWDIRITVEPRDSHSSTSHRHGTEQLAVCSLPTKEA